MGDLAILELEQEAWILLVFMHEIQVGGDCIDNLRRKSRFAE